MGAEAPMLRSRCKPGRCPVEGHDETCEMAGERPQRERHDEVIAVGRDMIEQWSTTLDLIAGICPSVATRSTLPVLMVVTVSTGGVGLRGAVAPTTSEEEQPDERSPVP